MFSLDKFRQEYDVEKTDYRVGDHAFKFFIPRKIDRFINQDDLFTGFPLWSKIWEATAVLSLHLSNIKPDPDKRWLEIGAGMGIAGIVAAKMGHKITITEYNKDAINFARANALLNNIDNVEIRELDWNQPLIEGKFDYIIASEVVYKEDDIMGLHLLFQRYLKPFGTIILAESMRRTTMTFVREMEKHYTMAMKKQAMKSKDKEIPVILFKLTPKP